MDKVFFNFRSLSLSTKVALTAVCFCVLSPWCGVMLALAAAFIRAQSAVELNKDADAFERYFWLWAVAPLLVATFAIVSGLSAPTDDLLRHLSAWELGLDYRAQYPWSDIPKADLWLGFDFLLGQLQTLGVQKKTLLIAVPLTAVVLGFIILFKSLQAAVPRHRMMPELFLLVALLGLVSTTPRLMLGRPEAFITLLGAAVWLCRNKKHGALWAVAFLCAIPTYWLGWVYAPFALLLTGWSFRQRLGLSLGLGLSHLAFWQIYTGNYLALLQWVRGTLSVPAVENAPLVSALAYVSGWGLILTLAWLVSLELRARPKGKLFKIYLSRLAPVVLIALWLSLPDQVRYQPALYYVVLPFFLRKLVAVAKVKGIARNGSVPLVLVIALWALGSFSQIPPNEPAVKFSLPSTARVYSEQPFAAVYFGQSGIAVEPSFAFGATKLQWRGIVKNNEANCELLKAGGFTHLVEKSLTKIPSCGALQQIQGAYRLWTIKD